MSKNLIYIHTISIPTDDLFLLFEPLITMDSIQYANGADGRKRRKMYDQSYSHQAITEYYETFQKVSVPLRSR